MHLAAEYVLPLKWMDEGPVEELAGYLGQLVDWIDVTVVDGSASPYFERHAASLPARVRHLKPHSPGGGCSGNGKVYGVVTGIRLARHNRIVVADDDVRYGYRELGQVVRLLDHTDLVRPQNYFLELPWHARWDTGRTLLNRFFGSDYPGTLGVRRELLEAVGGYSPDALFENLELIRTIRAAGGRETRADGVFVARLPCSMSHFLKQRVRQAYDSFAQPLRCAVELSLVPLLLIGRPKPSQMLVLGAVVVGLAEIGRRRNHGSVVFASTAALWAPLWVLERGVCSWFALASRFRGGVRYAGGPMLLAAHSERYLRTRSLVESTAAHVEGSSSELAPVNTHVFVRTRVEAS